MRLMNTPTQGPLLVCWATLLTLSCGPAVTPSAESPSFGLEPTPLARCQVGSGAQNPLVTEWAATDKARLESLLSSQPVFVSYTGCKLELVDQCRVAGSYEWVRTTLASDTVEIRSEDELWAKLPIGAAGLEAELGKSGRLQVRTRVAGQLRLAATSLPERPQLEACAAATHLVSAVSLGAFKLTRGSQNHLGGGVDAYGVGVEGRSDDARHVVHEAGVDAACERATPERADPNCASPLQLFLTPLAEPSQPPAGIPGAVRVSFPGHDDEVWTLYDSTNTVLCTTPCEQWVPPNSGYVLRRGSESVSLPRELPFRAGERAVADYHPERGNPTASAWLFWAGGAWTIFPGAAGLAIGIGRATADPVDCSNSTDPFCDDDENDDAAFAITGGAIFLALFGTSLYYYLYSRDASFTLRQPEAAGAASLKARGAGAKSDDQGLLRVAF